ncbi:MAG: hypothetical protein HRU38_22940 [Saccharospirillaceae bacterium]|nr:hypothetical protein [Pseudomonadales bacterium]NRB81481.1 hypothetical protein [Saccharospirillaceae bacterium]
MKRIIVALILSVTASAVFAGGKGGTEVALASYGGLGVTAAVGLPLDIKFLSDNGLNTYAELEMGIGINEAVNVGVELAGGVLVYVADGLSIYGSLGPAIGLNAGFGLGVEIGLNIDINKSSIFIEVGSHPSSGYVAVGMRL